MSGGLVMKAASDPPPFLAGGGDMGGRLRAHGWERTALGPSHDWPAALTTLVGVMLSSKQPMFVVWGPERTLLYNDAYAEVLAGKHPDALGRDFLEVWAEIRADLVPIVDQAYAGVPTQMDDITLILNRRGYPEETHFAFSYTPVHDEGGQVAGFFCPCNEITGQVIAERRLRESEARAKSVLDGMAEGFVLLDPDFRVVDVNQEGLRLEARPREALIGRSHWELHPGTEGSELGRLYQRAMVDRVPVALDHHHTCDDGRSAWLEMRAYPAAKGLAIFYRDVTERKRADAAAQEAAERYRLAARATNDAIWDWHFATDHVLWNEALETAYGHRSADVAPTGEWWIEHIHPDDRDRVSHGIHQAIDGAAGIWTDEYRFRRADGGYAEVLDRGHIIRDQNGTARRMIGAMLDLTGQRRAQAALRELNDALESRVAERTAELEQAHEALRQSQKMEAVGQLTGGIAHDFNNMLAVVIGSLDLLGRRIGAGDARATRYLHAAADGAKRAANLTQRLLAFSRQQPLRPEPIDANKLVAGMSELIRGSLGSDVRLETVLASGLWRTRADPNQLENVLLNLAVNARDAMPEGGRLTVETQNAHLDARYVSAQIGVQAGQYVLIAVTDTGSGMPPDVIAKAFDPFFTTKSVGKGTGLGLSQVYGFVKQSDGHVKIYSEPGQGTTVKVYLPRLVGGAAIDAEADGSADVPLGERDEAVLVVEDEASVRQFSTDALTELGYRVIEADGAAAALRLLDAHPEIALLFTDVVMPDVNGARLAEEARRRRPDLKVLFTTGYTRNAVVHNGVLDPGVELIGKPFTIEELAAKVREVIDGPGPNGSTG